MTTASGNLYPVLRLIAALVLMTTCGSAMYGSIMILEPVATEFGTGRGAGAFPYMAFMVGFGVGQVVMGRVADARGIVLPAMLGATALPIGFILASQATSLASLCLTLALACGLLGAAFSFGPMVADVSHWFSARRGLAMGIVISGSYCAGAVWPPILQGWIDSSGWRGALHGLGVLCLVVMWPCVLAFLRRPPAEDLERAREQAASFERPLGLSRHTLQACLCLAGVGCCVAMAMPQVHIVPFATDRGFAAMRGAEMLAVMLGFGVVSRVGSGWISDRIGGLKTLLLGSALQTLVLTGFLFADSLVSLYLLAAAFGLSQGGIVPSYAMIIRERFAAREAGGRIGLALLSTILGMALGGWIAGALYDLTGNYTASFLNAITFNLINLGIAGWLLMRAGSRAPVGAPTPQPG